MIKMICDCCKKDINAKNIRSFENAINEHKDFCPTCWNLIDVNKEESILRQEINQIYHEKIKDRISNKIEKIKIGEIKVIKYDIDDYRDDIREGRFIPDNY